MDKLYENIKNRRIALKMTQQELAEKMGYTNRSSIAKIESGAVDLNQSKIVQFAKILETTPSELMGGTGFTDDRTHGQPLEYYEDTTVQKVTEAMRTNPESRIVFDAVSDMKPEDLIVIAKLIEKKSD